MRNGADPADAVDLNLINARIAECREVGDGKIFARVIVSARR